MSTFAKKIKTNMIIFPCCKINLGLNVVERRPDGYHNIETVFYPIPLCDALDVKMMDDLYPSDVPCDLLVKTRQNGKLVTDNICPEQENLVVKAYNILANDFALPRVHAHLIKIIPSQAGLGGGSSDAAAMIRLLDERFRLNMGIARMERYAAKLGADCAFFITADPSYATGIGDILQPIDCQSRPLSGHYIALVKPDVAVSTGKAYAAITPQKPAYCCRDVVKLPISEWRGKLTNDFEEPVFAMHPELGVIKDKLYELGAEFALMSGSGSTLFGLFNKEPKNIDTVFTGCYTNVMKL